MKVRNRKMLVRVLREQFGYEGGAKDADREAVKSFIEDNGIELRGNDFDTIWKTVTISVSADAGEDVVVEDGSASDDDMETENMDEDEDDDGEKSARVPAKKSKPKMDPRYARMNAPAAHTSGLGRAHKAYNAKAARGLTRFSDADTAERAGAYMRLAIAATKGMSYSQRDNDEAIVGKAGSTLVNTSGGALVPDEYVAELLWLTEPTGAARRIARVQTMTRDVQYFPRRTNLQGFVHTTEGAASTGTDNAYDNVKLTADTSRRLAIVSNELFDDAAVSVADDIGNSMVEAADRRIDDDFILGDGTSTYGGNVGLTSALPSGAYISGTGSGWGGLVLTDFTNIEGSVENVNTARLAYLCSRQFYTQVMKKLAVAAGGNTATDISTFRGVNGSGVDAEFLGYPVYFSDSCPTTTASSQNACYFGDFEGGSMIGMRKELEIAASEHRYFDLYSTAFLGTIRTAINVHGDGRGSTFGPIVALVTG